MRAKRSSCASHPEENVEENNLVARDLDRLDVLCPAVLDTSWDNVEVAGSAVRGIENAH